MHSLSFAETCIREVRLFASMSCTDRNHGFILDLFIFLGIFFKIKSPKMVGLRKNVLDSQFSWEYDEEDDDDDDDAVNFINFG